MAQASTGRNINAHADPAVVRRRAGLVLAGFVGLSALLHFSGGQTIAILAPHWQGPPIPDQALSIISFSRIVQEHVQVPPTPTPTPTPIIAKRAQMNVAAMRNLEMGSTQLTVERIRNLARRHSDLIVYGPEKPEPAVTDAPVVMAVPPAPPRNVATSARAETGGSNDRLAGSIVWGDDNPPHVIEQAALTGASASHPVRIKVEIGPDGNVLSVAVEQPSGDGALDSAALDAARKSTYAPATLNGLPVHGTLILEFPPRIAGST